MLSDADGNHSDIDYGNDDVKNQLNKEAKPFYPMGFIP